MRDLAARVAIPPKDFDGLADAMRRVVRLPHDQRSALGKTVRERIRQHFDMNAKADQWEPLYSRLLRDRRSRALKTARDTLISGFWGAPIDVGRREVQRGIDANS